MSAQPQRNNTINLRDHTDWSAWMTQVQARCEIHDVWDNLRPLDPVPLISRPTRTAMPVPASYTPAANLQTLPPSLLSELSAQGQKAYKDDLEVYKIQKDDYKMDLHDYETQQKNLQHIVLLIQSTVAPYLLKTCCLPGHTIVQWLANLKLTAGVDDRIEQERARTRYQAALKPMRNIHNWGTWLWEYEMAATEATLHQVPEVAQINGITMDFISAVAKVATIWATNFQDTGRFEPLMSRREMVKRFREHMNVHHPLRPGKAASYVAADDASFLAESGASTQGQDRDAYQVSNASSSMARTRGRPRQKHSGNANKNPQQTGLPTSRKRGSEEGSAAAGRKCPACGMLHSVTVCWYLHEDQAPEMWYPNEVIKDLIEFKRKNDASFQGLLRGQSRSKLATPTIRKPYSSTPAIQELEEDQQ
jgi:hypothetical protein